MKISNPTYRTIPIRANTITFPLKEGTPMNQHGNIANDETAIGLITQTLEQPQPSVDILVAGDVYLDEVEKAYGASLTEDAINALTGIFFYKPDGKAIGNKGGGGGGGSTEQIFVATITKTLDTSIWEYSYSIDKTYAEMEAALEAKMPSFVYLDGRVVNLIPAYESFTAVFDYGYATDEITISSSDVFTHQYLYAETSISLEVDSVTGNITSSYKMIADLCDVINGDKNIPVYLFHLEQDAQYETVWSSKTRLEVLYWKYINATEQYEVAVKNTATGEIYKQTGASNASINLAKVVSMTIGYSISEDYQNNTRTYTLDKTAKEIYDAYKAGIALYLSNKLSYTGYLMEMAYAVDRIELQDASGSYYSFFLSANTLTPATWNHRTGGTDSGVFTATAEDAYPSVTISTT